MGRTWARAYGEPVEVQARDDGRPARFVWRGRLYTVRSIVEYWVANREWWREPGVARGRLETEFWRVEASAGQGMPTGTYELRKGTADRGWTLHRVAD